MIWGFRKAESREHREMQLTAGRKQRSGVKLISDLRLLTSMIDDFYSSYDFYAFYASYDFYESTI